MTTLTRTPTEARTSVAVRADGDRVRVRHSVEGPGPLVRPVLLASSTAGARVCLVPEGALLLAGDAIGIRVDVGPGVHLELVEPGGTVAYDMRGGSARWDVHVTLGAGASLVWHGEPFVVSAGARVTRRTTIEVADHARLALRETLVLGRHQEQGGTVRQLTTVAGPGGVPLLVEDLALSPGTDLLGGRRALGQVLALGVPPPADAFVLETGGSLTRRLGDHAHQVQPEGPWHSAVDAVRG